jgi:hypothetical protein
MMALQVGAVRPWHVTEKAWIDVSRPVNGIFAARRLKVRLDDIVVARLFRGRKTRVEVEPGIHTIQARVDWTKSPPIEVDLAAGDEISIEVSAPWSALWRTWTTPSRALICSHSD